MLGYDAIKALSDLDDQTRKATGWPLITGELSWENRVVAKINRALHDGPMTEDRLIAAICQTSLSDSLHLPLVGTQIDWSHKVARTLAPFLGIEVTA